MGNKVIGIFTKNIGLKLIAVMFALALWFVVVNVDNPNKSGNFTVPVDIQNEEILTDAGKYVSVSAGGAVTFRATAKRSVFDRLSNEDFVAVADFKNLEDDRRVPIEIRAKNYSRQITISTKVHYLEVEISDVQKSKFVISPVTKGDPADGFGVSDISVSPNVITVKGPEDIVSTISYVSATVDVSGMSEDLIESVIPKCYDEEDNEVNTTQLTLSESTVSVRVTFDREVAMSLHVETSGQLAEGLSLDSITTDPEKIMVRGDSAKLNKLTAITIPGSAVNLSNVTRNMTTTVDITEFLPDGISLSKGQDSRVEVVIKLKDVSERKFEVNTANFTIRNLGEGKTASFLDATLDVMVYGFDDDLEKLSASDITGTVDASGLEEGEQTVRVEISLDDKFSADSVVATIRVVTTAVEEPEGSEETEETEEEN